MPRDMFERNKIERESSIGIIVNVDGKYKSH